MNQPLRQPNCPQALQVFGKNLLRAISERYAARSAERLASVIPHEVPSD